MSHNFQKTFKNIPSPRTKCMSYIDSPFHSVHHRNKSIYSLSQSFSSSIHQSSEMVPEMEKPRVTEIMVRMDCNGCVQKIKKSLHGITGIYDIYIDFPQQKLTVIGWADPEKIVKAIKKTRKTAIICSHTEPQSEEPPQTEQGQEPDSEAPPEGGAPPPEPNTPPTEPSQTEATPPPPPPESQNEPPPPPPESQNEPPPPPEAENPPSEAKQPNESGQDNTSHHNEPSRPKNHEEVHVIYHHPPPEYRYRYPYGHYAQPMDPTYRETPPQQPQPPPQQPQPVYVTQNYNSYKPSPYVTEYAYPHRQSPLQYSYYSRPEPYNPVNYNGYSSSSSSSNSSDNGNGNITSIFSEENPNSCTII